MYPLTIYPLAPSECCGEELVEQEQKASLGFANQDSDSDNNLGVSLLSQQNLVRMFPSGCPGGQFSGTNEEVAPGGYTSQHGVQGVSWFVTVGGGYKCLHLGQ